MVARPDLIPAPEYDRDPEQFSLYAHEQHAPPERASGSHRRTGAVGAAPSFMIPPRPDPRSLFSDNIRRSLMTSTGHRVLLFVVVALLATSSVSAQTTDPRLDELERKLEALTQQVSEIRQQLDALKAAPVTPEPSTPSLADVQPIENQAPAAAAAKALNPDMSVIGTMVGHAGHDNPFEFGEPRAPFDFDEAELAFTAFIDPYAKGNVFIAVGPEGAEVEEAYAQFVTLPYGLTAKAGKVKANFGKANLWHTHQRRWVDQPLMIQNFFGAEGLADSGISVSKSIDNPFGAFIEATGEVFSGDVENVFARSSSNDLFYNAHLKLFKDLSENSNLEVGTSFARGTVPDANDSSRFAGFDVTYRWKPLQRSIYNSVIARVEALVNDRGDVGDNLYGMYAAADYQFSRRWFAGVRFDRADRAFLFGEPLEGRVTDRGVSAVLTFWPSEFSQLRGQLRRTRYGGLETVNELLLQLQFSIGAHGAHTF
jgi:hypothetical protein